MSNRFWIAGTAFLFGLGVYFIASAHQGDIGMVLPL